MLDDNGISKKLDNNLALLNSHPNIEIRLFNPFMWRSPKVFNYLTDFHRLNHRMHNKSFTVDNTATVIGGRNIGDEYFGATDQVLFADLDLLAFGPVVQSVSDDFDKYWASPLAYPIDQIISLSSQNTIEHLHLTEQLLTYQLNHAVGSPESQVDLVSPYFVPTKTGTDGFKELLDKPSMQVRVLTNSYEATDVAAVHAGYIKRRKDLLKAGMEVYELKSNSSGHLKRHDKSPFGSSGSSLHAKTFAIDNERVFIGSFNFDPRSANLNTELGFVIHSPALAKEISTLFTQQVPYSSYQVILDKNQNEVWLERHEDESVIRHTIEPGTHLFSRWWVQLMSKLPIEWML